MPLTDRAVRSSQPKAKSYKVSDMEGLHLLVCPNGSRLWRLSYRFGGKQKTLSFGAYPTVSLAQAREKRRSAKQLLSEGTDPAVQAKLEKLKRQIASANTFGAIANEWLEKIEREGRAEATMKKNRWLIDLVRPHLGNRPITEINAMEVLLALQKVEARGRLETARRLRSTIGTVFRYAMATARVDGDPTIALRGALAAPKPKPRAAITDPKKLGPLLRAIDEFEAHIPVRAALRLLPLLFPRPGELRQAEWVEFDFDARLWSVPADRMKMRRPHRVPLPMQAIDVLKDLRESTGDLKLVFPQIRTLSRPISDGTLNAALRRLGYGADEVTPHGFRATAASLLNESGKWNPDAIDRQLAHLDENEVRRAYVRSTYWDERVEMMQWWADYLDELKGRD